MRRAAKVDANHKAVVDALRKAGATVQDLSALGKGCPDIAVGFRGQNFLLEIKDGTLPPSRKMLTEDQVIWHSKWRGQVRLVESPWDALHCIGAANGNEK